MAGRTLRSVGAFVVVILATLGLYICPRKLTAQGVTYLYDDLGRLKRVIDEHGDVATYNYDAVGNILSIERGAGQCPAAAPVVATVSIPVTRCADVTLGLCLVASVGGEVWQ